MKKIIIFLVAVMSFAMASAQNYTKAKAIFAYGIAYSLEDSVAYASAVMPIENAYVQKKTQFLYARNEYSYQFKTYLEPKGSNKMMVVVSFATTRPKAEKKFLKVVSKLTKSGYLVKHVSTDEFTFKGVEYSDPE